MMTRMFCVRRDNNVIDAATVTLNWRVEQLLRDTIETTKQTTPQYDMMEAPKASKTLVLMTETLFPTNRYLLG